MNGTKIQPLGPVRVADGSARETPEVSALVERARAGEADAFEDLMRRYEGRVIALGIHMGLPREDARDVCQDAFIRVFKYIHRFRSGEIFYRWLHRIALNVVFDHLRRCPPVQVPLHEVHESSDKAFQAGGLSPLEQIEAGSLKDQLHQALNCLSRRERTVIVLRDLHQMPTEQVAAVLGISQITIRRHCMTARQKLKERLKGLQ